MNTLAEYAAKAIEKAEADVDLRPWPDGEPEARRKLKAPRKSLDTLDMSNERVETAVKAARGWAQRKRDGYENASLVLSGPVGTGKTHIATAILWSIVTEPEGAPMMALPVGRFWMANDLLLELSPHVDEYGRVHPSRVSSVVGEPYYNDNSEWEMPPLVVIDDVGGQMVLPFISQQDDDHEREIQARYFRFIDYCYTKGISIIMTTNLSLAGGHRSALARHLGDRAWDRLCQMAPAGYMVSLDGVPSWRVKQGGR